MERRKSEGRQNCVFLKSHERFLQVKLIVKLSGAILNRLTGVYKRHINHTFVFISVGEKRSG